MGTGDCLHPLWKKELNNNLIEYSDEIFFTSKISDVFFILQSEIEAIWNNNSNNKKIHFILLFPNGKFWFLIGHDCVYGKLNFEN